MQISSFDSGLPVMPSTANAGALPDASSENAVVGPEEFSLLIAALLGGGPPPPARHAGPGECSGSVSAGDISECTREAEIRLSEKGKPGSEQTTTDSGAVYFLPVTFDSMQENDSLNRSSSDKTQPEFAGRMMTGRNDPSVFRQPAIQIEEGKNTLPFSATRQSAGALPTEWIDEGKEVSDVIHLPAEIRSDGISPAAEMKKGNSTADSEAVNFSRAEVLRNESAARHSSVAAMIPPKLRDEASSVSLSLSQILPVDAMPSESPLAGAAVEILPQQNPEWSQAGLTKPANPSRSPMLLQQTPEWPRAGLSGGSSEELRMDRSDEAVVSGELKPPERNESRLAGRISQLISADAQADAIEQAGAGASQEPAGRLQSLTVFQTGSDHAEGNLIWNDRADAGQADNGLVRKSRADEGRIRNNLTAHGRAESSREDVRPTGSDRAGKWQAPDGKFPVRAVFQLLRTSVSSPQPATGNELEADRHSSQEIAEMERLVVTKNSLQDSSDIEPGRNGNFNVPIPEAASLSSLPERGKVSLPVWRQTDPVKEPGDSDNENISRERESNSSRMKTLIETAFQEKMTNAPTTMKADHSSSAGASFSVVQQRTAADLPVIPDAEMNSLSLSADKGSANASSPLSETAMAENEGASDALPINEIVAQTIAKVRATGERLLPQETQALSFILAPESLGQLEIRLTRDADGNLAASLTAERQETQHLLQEQLEDLRFALDRAGVSLHHVEIIVDDEQRELWPAPWLKEDFSGESAQPFSGSENQQPSHSHQPPSAWSRSPGAQFNASKTAVNQPLNRTPASGHRTVLEDRLLSRQA